MFTRLTAAVIAIAVIATVSSPFALAQGKKAQQQKLKKDIESAIAKGPGVHVVTRDDKGRIQTCLVVAETRISTVLGYAKGLLTAKRKARLGCGAEFVKWLKTSVDIREKNDNEVILFLEGSQDNDKETLKESGKSVDKTTASVTSVAKGLVRGFEPVYQNADRKSKIYTLVVRWSAKDADSAKAIGKK